MKRLTKLSAGEILSIPSDQPECLYTEDQEAARSEYRSLAAFWHPDRHHAAEAGQVFGHIGVLYRAAQARWAGGSWRQPGLQVLTALDGTRYEIRYRKQHAFELGDVLISPTMVAYLICREHEDLYAAALRVIAGLPFAHAQMQAQMTPSLPKVVCAFETRDVLVLVLAKTPQQVSLVDLLAYAAGCLDPRHVAWIVSRLFNIACYLDYAGLTHNALSPQSCFVDPTGHGVALLGGWWYACRQGGRLLALPERSVALATPDLLSGKHADTRLDLAAIRSIAHELLGDERGGRLAADAGVPAALQQWLRLASTGNARQDYQQWQSRTLPDSFGPRRFVRWDVSADDIYPAVC